MNEHTWKMTLFGIAMGVATGVAVSMAVVNATYQHVCF